MHSDGDTEMGGIWYSCLNTSSRHLDPDEKWDESSRTKCPGDATGPGTIISVHYNPMRLNIRREVTEM